MYFGKMTTKSNGIVRHKLKHTHVGGKLIINYRLDIMMQL